MNDSLVALKMVNVLITKHLNKAVSLLRTIAPLAKDFQSKSDIIPPYNIILAASDIYYHENYHSDIMAYILKNKKDTIKYFIDYINTLSDKLKINKDDYLETEVVREENRIDILIRDLKSNHCIIVENKINNAGDMERQLPKYYNTVVEKKGYTVDCILYFSLDGKKRPDKSTWTPEDLQLDLDRKIVFGAAVNESKNDFINLFLVRCKNNTDNEQEKAFYCQYIDLLEYLRRRNQMDYQLMEKFYKEMLNAEQYSSAQSIRAMLDDFLTYRRDRIHDHFLNNHAPFEKTFTYLKNDTIYEFIRDIAPEEDIKIDIWADESQTLIRFWIQEPKKEKIDLIKAILAKIGEDGRFTKEDTNSYVTTFKFPEEDAAMYEYLAKLFKLLDKNKNSINL